MSEAAAAASGSGHPRIWARREPRPHISSVCSVGESSTLADEVNEVLGRIDPNDLQDIGNVHLYTKLFTFLVPSHTRVTDMSLLCHTLVTYQLL